jgi:hypothetical protein
MSWAVDERSEEERVADRRVVIEALREQWPKDLCVRLGQGIEANADWTLGRGPRPDLVSLIAALRLEWARRTGKPSAE